MTPLGHLFGAYGYSNQGFNILLATDHTVGESNLDKTEAGLISRWFRSVARVWDCLATGSRTPRQRDAAVVLTEGSAT